MTSLSRFITVVSVFIVCFIFFFLKAALSPVDFSVTNSHQQLLTHQVGTPRSSSSSPPSLLPSNFIFSCFYFRSDFYSGRKVPSLDWIIVMIESAFAVTTTTSTTTISTTTTNDELRRQQNDAAEDDDDDDKKTKLVMFVDALTKERLEQQIRSRVREKNRPNFLSLGFLELVLIDEKNDEEVKSLFQTNSWADSARLKNAANNFRFWFIQRYLKQLMMMMQAKKQSENRHDDDLAATKILIVDATDVLFQRNPFAQKQKENDGVCFPRFSSSSPASNKKSHSCSYFLFTLEDASKNFHNEVYNKKWMKCYDHVNDDVGDDDDHEDDTYESVSSPSSSSSSSSSSPLAQMAKIKMRISCAGVSLGTFYGVLAYLSAQLREISKPKLAQCAAETVKAALDQATHNYLMWRGVHRRKIPSSSPLSSPVNYNLRHRDNNGNKKKIINPWQRALEQVAGLASPTGTDFDKHSLIVASVPHFRQRQAKSSFQKGADWNIFVLPPPTTTTTSTNSHDNRSNSEQQLAWDASSDCVFHGNFAKLKMKSGEVVFDDKNAYAIVHQYTSDRHPKVMKVARQKYDLD